jgi:hypothetical protein
MDAGERKLWIERYAAGPARLRDALARVPPDALQWRPAPEKWSAHEVVGHCADSETISSTRIRFLVGEDRPTIAGYDQDRWAKRFDYHVMPLDLALRQIDQVRAWTTAWIRGLPDAAWSREGTHTESGRYSAEIWLKIYAEHLEIHARQIDRIVEAWVARPAHPKSGSQPAGRETP